MGSIKHEPGQVRKYLDKLTKELDRAPIDSDVAWVAQPSLINSVWKDIPAVHTSSKQFTGYPTQKPVSLLERIIEVSSNEGDVVLDPFAGSCTTCIAAERLDRQWIGMDMWEGTEDIVNQRMKDCGIDERIKKTRL